MASKRDHDALSYSDTEEPFVEAPTNKRRREQQPHQQPFSKSKPKQSEAKTDATYGQRVVFPGLDDPSAAHSSDDDLEYEDEGDAFAYLRSVRQEASVIPHIIVAPKPEPRLPAPSNPYASSGVDRTLYDNGVGDTRGYYRDGAYMAAPEVDSSSEEEGEYDGDDQSWGATRDRASANKALRDAYYASLVSRFTALRATLQKTPPTWLVSLLPKQNGVEVGSFGPNSWTFRVWSNRIRYTDPLPAQIAAIDRHAALKLLRVILGGKFIRRGYELRERTSRWIWALLAKLPDSGEMDYADVGWVRELGKRAVLMMMSMAHMKALQGEVEEDLEGIDPDVAAAAKDDDGDDWVGDIEVAEMEVAEMGEVNIEDLPDNELEQPSDVPLVADEPAGSNVAAGPGADEDDLEMDMEIDEGEVSDEPTSLKDIEADIEAAKARLLARIENSTSAAPEDEQQAFDTKGKGLAADQDGEEAASDETRRDVNTRATLNMILTVAGEFYGQRDLLEFRDPFPSL
ncbi:hypothetical protein B0T22DRAFT_450264 [Podospora appendiculata]|uniref:Uncharacterized protein n=1 Tax=Podospora appendiculata TaxID=314037 RepID=A0AAE1CGD4_9PEZI|nr:hypothetical protein B0T22DRAFT_450264 [Podospora appendiculata]